MAEDEVSGSERAKVLPSEVGNRWFEFPFASLHSSATSFVPEGCCAANFFRVCNLQQCVLQHFRVSSCFSVSELRADTN